MIKVTGEGSSGGFCNDSAGKSYLVAEELDLLAGLLLRDHLRLHLAGHRLHLQGRLLLLPSICKEVMQFGFFAALAALYLHMGRTHSLFGQLKGIFAAMHAHLVR